MDHGTAAQRVVTAWQAVGRDSIEPATWDAVVDTSDDGWLWHRHGFQDVLTTWGSRRDRSIALVDGSGAIGCVLPIHEVTLRAGPIRLASIESFGGPCFAASLDPGGRAALRTPILRELRGAARRHRAPHISSSLPPLAPAAARADRNPLLDLGFEDRSDLSWIVPLDDDVDVIWSRVQSRTRRYIRSAQREGVSVRNATAADLDAYYKLHLETTTRTGTSPHPRAYFEAIWRDLVPAGLADGYVVEHEDRIVAACNVARYKDGVVYWTAASNDLGRRIHANDLLLWEVIRSAAEGGHAAVELGDVHATSDASAKHKTISRFKSKFAGGTRPLHRGRLTVAGPVGRLRQQAVEAAVRWRVRRRGR